MRIVGDATRTWALLVLLTLLSMVTGHAGFHGLAGSGIVLAACVVKGRSMLMDFLKLRDGPAGWRALFAGWLVLIAASAWIAPALSVLRN
ncbi:cytochrome C oxidase subunit IV family protein [Microvirga arsenatis]|uniref:Cytochrome C oxidase subunit IV n=1 Tax=Microvirga arsenatis TaxID=2692265 RepID=A0ABW9YYK5_9HYPH|nr:cytochrome C oxidase subunit IV family protein [Microvirga arsenatis]NBJ10521.1 hypothetical protein [Microvirga arsenatis]NBJ24580.1 hypothetical protein [Microvirga arsenatis]